RWKKKEARRPFASRARLWAEPDAVPLRRFRNWPDVASGQFLRFPIHDAAALVAGHHLVSLAGFALDVGGNLEVASVAFALADGHNHRQAGLAGEPVVEPLHRILEPFPRRRDRCLDGLELALQPGLALAQEANARLVPADVLLQLLPGGGQLPPSLVDCIHHFKLLLLQGADGGLRMPDLNAQRLVFVVLPHLELLAPVP